MVKWPRRKCLICRDWFHPKFSNEWWCCPEHGAELAIKRRSRDREKAEAKLKKEQQQGHLEWAYLIYYQNGQCGLHLHL